MAFWNVENQKLLRSMARDAGRTASEEPFPFPVVKQETSPMNESIQVAFQSLCLASVLAVAPPSLAATRHVSPAGNDSNDGLTPETALLTPAAAVEIASPGDEILLAEGLYLLADELKIAKSVTLRGANRDTTILRAASRKRAVSISADGAVLSSVTVTDGYSGNSGGNVYMNAAGLVTNCVLRNGVSTGNGTGGAAIWLSAGIVADTIITNNKSEATLHAHTGGALHIKGEAVAERCLVAYNRATCRGDGLAGPAGVLMNHKSALMRDCTIVGNAGQFCGGVHTYGGGLTTNSIVAGNIAYRNTAAFDTIGGGNTLRGCLTDREGLSSGTFTNYTGIIDFVDPVHGDWRPRLTSTAYQGEASPCIGAFARIPTGAPECDFSAISKKGIAPFATRFIAATENFPSAELTYTWTFGDGSDAVMTGTPAVSHDYTAPGRYDVSLVVSGGNATAAVTYREEVVVVSPVLHVTAVNADASEPYDSWGNAATNLQTVLDHAVDGCTIIVDDGRLPVRDGRAVFVTKGVTIKSRSGDPAKAAIGRYDTQEKFRLLEFNHEAAVLSDLAIENGYLVSYYDVGGNIRINKRGGTVTNCIIRNGTMINQGSGGAGIGLFNGLLTHSVISNNFAKGQSDVNHTGAIDLLGGRVESCLVTGNRSDSSSGGSYPDVAGVNVQGGSLRNSTIVGNSGKTCGGVWVRHTSSATVVNCTIAGNVSRSVGVSANDVYGTTGRFSYCATPDPIEGGADTCVSGPVLFANPEKDDFTPAPGSVALGAGLVEEWMATGGDLAGNPRLGDDGLVDIGAYERVATGLAASVTADRLAGAAPLAVRFHCDVSDGVGSLSFAWDFSGDGTPDLTTTLPEARWSYPVPGAYIPVVTVTDESGQQTSARLADPISVAVAVAYVVPDPSFEGSVAPYGSWETAATSIHDALDVAGDGTRVILRAGDYPIKKQLLIEIGVSLESETGIPEDVVIRRGAVNELCLVSLNHPGAKLSGLTVADGRTSWSSGANIYVRSMGGTVTNCIIRNGQILNGNEVTGAGIRLDGGLATHCVITGNVMRARGNNHTGGAIGLHNFAVADTCLIARNICGSTRGTEVSSPVHIVSGTFRNCTIVDNVSSNGYAGVYYYAGGNQLGAPVVIENCLFARNRSLVDQPRADLANDSALAKMSHCASDVDPGEDYAENCLFGPVLFKNAAKGDYRPVPPSTGLRAARITDGIAAGATDLLGLPFLRESGAADIGAYRGYDIAPLILILR